MSIKTTTRYYATDLEIRSVENSRRVSGYALKFNSLSQDLGGFREQISPQALDGCDLSDVVCLLNHDPNQILARTTAKTLTLSIDNVGLRFDFDAPNTTAGNDLLTNIRNGNITGCSFSFIVAKGGDEVDRTSEIPIRTIRKIAKILDCSPVVFPAYQSTEIYNRFLESVEIEKRALTTPDITFKNSNMKKLGLFEIAKQAIENRFSPELKQIMKRGENIAQNTNIQPTPAGILIPLEERALTVAASPGIPANPVFEFLEPLRNELVFTKLGCKYLSGLTYDLSLPRLNGSVVNWENEVDEAQDASSTLERIIYKPKRLTGTITVSRQLILQTDGQAEELIKADLVKAVASRLEETVLGKHVSSTKMPDGFFTTAPDPLGVGGVGKYDDLLDLDLLLDNDKINQNRAFLVNGAAARILKGRPISASENTGYLLQNGKMIDIPVFKTGNIPSGVGASEDGHGLILGAWDNLIIASWFMEIIVDPFSKAKAGAVEITIHAFLDAKPRNPNAFQVRYIK